MQHDLPGHKLEPGKSPIERSRRLCGLHLLEPVKSPIVLSRQADCAGSTCQSHRTRLARPAAVRPPLIGAEQVSVIHSSPFLRETHPRRESNEESPESRRLFGAGLGARSPQRTPRGKHRKANTITQKRTLPCRRLRSLVPRVPPSLRSPSGSPPENAHARSEPRKPDNRTDDSRTRYRRSRPTAEQERNISQAVLFGAHAANSRRDRA